MTIPDEAVDAAFRSMYGPGPSNPANDGDAHLLKELRKALEAAAPHMLAEAWEEGEFAGEFNLAGEECPDSEPITNPYRSQA